VAEPAYRQAGLATEGRLVDAIMYYLYAISSKTRKYIYVGITNNLSRRIDEHNKGYNKTTRAYRSFRLIMTEEYRTRTAAREREKYLKSGFGKEFLKKMI
jgi:putative endonuclease